MIGDDIRLAELLHSEAEARPLLETSASGLRSPARKAPKVIAQRPYTRASSTPASPSSLVDSPTNSNSKSDDRTTVCTSVASLGVMTFN